MNASDDPSMLAPIVMLQVTGMLGSLDLLYYHFWKFSLYRQLSSRLEHVTHLLHSSSFVAGLAALLIGFPQGGWFWVLAGLLVLDFVIGITDVLVEPKSREPLGGLPPLEYLVHMVANAMTGVTAGAFLVLGWPSRNFPTALVPQDLGGLVTANGWLMVSAGMLFTLLEITLFAESIRTKGWRSDRVIPPRPRRTILGRLSIACGKCCSLSADYSA